MAWTLAEKLQERFDQPVIVENRADGGGTIGAHIVVKAPPDGYTPPINAGSAMAVSLALQPLPYDVQRDLAPVLLISRASFSLVVNPSVPVRTRLENEGGDVVGSTPEQFAAYVEIETAKWAKVVKQVKI